MKEILITGANGFIGSNLVEHALAEGYSVTAAVRATSDLRFLRDSRIRILSLDFANEEILRGQLERHLFRNGRPDFIVHNAGITKAVTSEEFMTVNGLYTRRFAHCLEATGMTPSKFVYISSLAAFGPGTGSSPVSESQPPRPISAYGKSKLLAEKALASMPHFPYIIIRPTTVYGPKERNVFLSFKMLMKNLEIYLSNRGQLSSFIHVSDLCRLVLRSLESSPIRRSYFAFDGYRYRTEEFMKISKRILNKKTVVVNLPVGVLNSVAFVSRLVSRLTGYASIMNRDRIKEFVAPNWTVLDDAVSSELHFKPRFDLESGLRHTIGWYRTNGWL